MERTEIALLLGIGAAVGLAVWFVVLGALAVRTRPRDPDAVSAGLELGGSEPPAVVNLITCGWRLRREAVPATLLDLAARGVVRVEEPRENEYVVRVKGDDFTPDEVALTPYEKQVLTHVRSIARKGVVPAPALTTGPAEKSRRWWRKFHKAVIADARARGVSRSRWTTGQEVLLTVIALVPAGLAGASLATLALDSDGDEIFGAFFFGAGVVGAICQGAFRLFTAERDTDSGLGSAGRWLGLRNNLRGSESFARAEPTAVAVWDRLFAYGAALRIAAPATRALPFGQESETHAWSAVTGEWRTVEIAYRRPWPPGWGDAPWKTLLSGLALSGLMIALLVVVVPAAWDDSTGLDFDAAGTRLAVAIGVTIVGALLAWGLTRAALGALDIRRERTVDGYVLRRKDEHNKGTLIGVRLAVDDGTTNHVRAWRFNRSNVKRITGDLTAGRWIRATVSPRLGYVRAIGPRSPDDSDSTQ